MDNTPEELRKMRERIRIQEMRERGETETVEEAGEGGKRGGARRGEFDDFFEGLLRY